MSSGYPYHTETATTVQGSASTSEVQKPKDACSVHHCWETALYNCIFAEGSGATHTQRCELHKAFTWGSVSSIQPIQD